MKKVFLTTAAVLISFSSSFAYQDIYPSDAHEMLLDTNAIMIDVRTPEEWAWVGHPGKNKLGEGAEIEDHVINISWEIEKPGRNYKLIENKLFLQDVDKLNLSADTPIITICRSGGRSKAAAIALEAAGYTNVYNTLQGFEGGTDSSGYRSLNEGWKNTGLPYAFGYSGNIDYHIIGN